MVHLFDRWQELDKAIKKSKRILLALDYDGTLTPIVSRPELAVLSPAMRKTINLLTKKKKIIVGIISGRQLTDVKNLVKIKNIYYAGNHGLEIIGPNFKFIHPSYSRFRPSLDKIKDELSKKIRKIKGVIVEDKGLTLSIHYRLVDKRDFNLLKKIFNQTTSIYKKTNKIRITHGKKVWEIRPPLEWHKGKAIKTIKQIFLKKSTLLAIYIGDDTTDEDAFRAMSKQDISIYVGKPKLSHAKYFLHDCGEVKKFLDRLGSL